MKVQIIRKQGIELDSQDTALCEKRTMLFYNCEKVRDQRRIRDYDRLSEERSAFRSADVKDIAESCQIPSCHVIFRGSESVGKSRTIHIEREMVLTACLAEVGQFFQGIQGSVFRRLGDIDHARHDHVLMVIIR